MRLGLGRASKERLGQRGAAVIELALCMIILMPFVLALIDYAYYFYVGMNIVEAQHEGLVAASQTTVTDCTLVANAAAKGSAVTAAQNAETAYLANAGLNSVVTLVNNAPACPCTAAVSNTCWDMTMAADFKPIIGWVGWWMKKSPTTPTQVRFTAKTQVVAGN
jgi:hypothetical protein